jgi:hypothetical protein
MDAGCPILRPVFGTKCGGIKCPVSKVRPKIEAIAAPARSSASPASAGTPPSRHERACRAPRAAAIRSATGITASPCRPAPMPPYTMPPRSHRLPVPLDRCRIGTCHSRPAGIDLCPSNRLSGPASHARGRRKCAVYRSAPPLGRAFFLAGIFPTTGANSPSPPPLAGTAFPRRARCFLSPVGRL